MKKAFIILAIGFLATVSISAQGFGGGRGERGGRTAPEQVKIDGTLQLQKGQFAVASGSNIYYVPMIGRYAGFIEGLKEGANVSFEGYVRGNFLRPVKMTVNGKTYELDGGRGPGGPGGGPGGPGGSADGGRKKDGFGKAGPWGFGPGSCCVPYGGPRK